VSKESPAAMADEKDIIIENLRRSGAKLSLEVLGLRNFIGIAIDHVRGGGALGDSELAAIRDRCLFNVKNFDSSGMPLNQEADAIRQALSDLEDMLNLTIIQARKG
jgi:hypothetical protein